MTHESAFTVVSPAPRAEWSDIVAASDEAMAFSTPEWLDCVCASGTWTDASRLYETVDGRRFVVPLARRRSPGSRWAPQASIPYGWGFGGVVSSGQVAPGDVATVAMDLSQSTAVQTSIRPNPLSVQTWRAVVPDEVVAVPRRAHVLDLSGGFEAVWTSRFTGMARTAVRKAERSGLTVECDTTGRLVPVFYELYLKSLERWNPGRLGAISRWRGRRRDSLEKFRTVSKYPGGVCRVWVAWLDGCPAASIVTLFFGNNANCWRGAMDESLAGPTRANYLLHRLAIEDACTSGCQQYHMGETGTSASLAQFKSRFGARPHDYDEYRFERLPLTSVGSRLDLLVERGRDTLGKRLR
jgi:hypothetical protein